MLLRLLYASRYGETLGAILRRLIRSDNFPSIQQLDGGILYNSFLDRSG